MDYKKIIEGKEYDFLRSNPILKETYIMTIKK